MMMRPCALALTLALARGAAASPAAFVAARVAVRDDPAIEPYAYLNNGAFSGPAAPLSPDPLVRFQWGSGANLTDLQLYDVLPASAALTPGTPADAFAGLASLATPSPRVTVAGAGGFVIDFGVESAAWLELDVLAASAPSPADLGLVRLGLSEWAEPLQNKWREPVPYGAQPGGVVTLRLEPSAPGPQLYEGLRFGFVNMSAAPSAPFTIVAARAVSQAKPVNYTGAFAAAGDDLLTRIWYTAAYSVRVNLERDYFGAVLVNRGDRESWCVHGALRAAETAPVLTPQNPHLPTPIFAGPATRTWRRPLAWWPSATSTLCSTTSSARRTTATASRATASAGRSPSWTTFTRRTTRRPRRASRRP